jgi:hypothetical protein
VSYWDKVTSLFLCYFYCPLSHISSNKFLLTWNLWVWNNRFMTFSSIAKVSVHTKHWLWFSGSVVMSIGKLLIFHRTTQTETHPFFYLKQIHPHLTQLCHHLTPGLSRLCLSRQPSCCCTGTCVSGTTGLEALIPLQQDSKLWFHYNRTWNSDSITTGLESFKVRL